MSRSIRRAAIGWRVCYDPLCFSAFMGDSERHPHLAGLQHLPSSWQLFILRRGDSKPAQHPNRFAHVEPMVENRGQFRKRYHVNDVMNQLENNHTQCFQQQTASLV